VWHPQPRRSPSSARSGSILIPGTGLLAAAIRRLLELGCGSCCDYGTMPLAEILAPAIGYAENGYPMARRIKARRSASSPTCFAATGRASAAVYLPGGAPPVAGRLFRNPTLAATYRSVLTEAGDGARERQIERARAAWYRGFVAAADRPFFSAGSKRSWIRRDGAITGC